MLYTTEYVDIALIASLLPERLLIRAFQCASS